jgi:hypothetical protein
MYELEATADVLLITGQGKAAIDRHRHTGVTPPTPATSTESLESKTLTK